MFNTITNSQGEEYSKYVDAGYDSSNFFLLLGPLFFIGILYVFYLAVKRLLKLALRKCADNFLTRRVRKSDQVMIFLTRFLLEGCIEIGLSAMITVLLMESENFDYFWEAVSTICAFVSLLALSLAPFYFFRITKQYLGVKLGGQKKKKKKVKKASKTKQQL